MVSNVMLLILMLFILTYGSRLIGLVIFTSVTLSPNTKRYFSYIPVSIMVALLMQQLVVYDGKAFSFSLPVLVGGFICASFMKLKENFMLAMVLGMASGLLVRYLI